MQSKQAVIRTWEHNLNWLSKEIDGYKIMNHNMKGCLGMCVENGYECVLRAGSWYCLALVVSSLSISWVRARVSQQRITLDWYQATLASTEQQQQQQQVGRTLTHPFGYRVLIDQLAPPDAPGMQLLASGTTTSIHLPALPSTTILRIFVSFSFHFSYISNNIF